MPINIHEIESQIDVEAPGSGKAAAHAQPLSETLLRWRQAAHRDAELCERVAAQGFDD